MPASYIGVTETAGSLFVYFYCVVALSLSTVLKKLKVQEIDAFVLLAMAAEVG